jgi:large subunit ribosomal protein L17e
MGKYSRKPAVEAKSAKSRVDDLRAHFKNTFETATAIRGWNLKKA